MQDDAIVVCKRVRLAVETAARPTCTAVFMLTFLCDACACTVVKGLLPGREQLLLL